MWTTSKNFFLKKSIWSQTQRKEYGTQRRKDRLQNEKDQKKSFILLCQGSFALLQCLNTALFNSEIPWCLSFWKVNIKRYNLLCPETFTPNSNLVCTFHSTTHAICIVHCLLCTFCSQTQHWVTVNDGLVIMAAL